MQVMKADLECEKLRDLPRTPCPDELQRTRILQHKGFECKVYFNYVDLGEYGANPVNVWWGLVLSDEWNWPCPLNEKERTLEEACDIIEPLFKAAVDRKLRHNQCR